MLKFIVACFVCGAAAQPYTALSIIQGGFFDPGIRGWVKFWQADASSNVTVTAYLTNITVNPDALHGLHIHTWGDISDPNGTAAGGHWNPFGKNHGCPETNGTERHAGDMGNWNVVGGVLNQTKTLDLLTLTGPNSIVGRAVIFHQNTDDCVQVATGNAGNRLAQGVVGLDVNSTANAAGANITRGVCRYSSAYGVADGQVWITDNSWNGDLTSGATIEGWFDGTGVAGIDFNHAYHIHRWSDISNLANTGTHYNPFNAAVHGVPPFPVREAGDLGNIYHTNQTTLRQYYRYIGNNLVTLNFNSSVLGRAMVIHALADNCTAFWGARIAGCVIGIANPATFPSASPLPVEVPTTQANAALCGLSCANGTDGACTPVQTQGAEVCVSYQSRCTAGDASCSASEIAQGFVKAHAVGTTQATFGTLLAQPSVYLNLTGCYAPNCNPCLTGYLPDATSTGSAPPAVTTASSAAPAATTVSSALPAVTTAATVPPVLTTASSSGATAGPISTTSTTSSTTDIGAATQRGASVSMLVALLLGVGVFFY